MAQLTKLLDRRSGFWHILLDLLLFVRRLAFLAHPAYPPLMPLMPLTREAVLDWTALLSQISPSSEANQISESRAEVPAQAFNQRPEW